MRGAIEIKNKAKGERVVKALKRKQIRAKADADVGISGAGKQIEKLERELAAQGKIIAGLTVVVDKLWKWKMEQEMKEGE